MATGNSHNNGDSVDLASEVRTLPWVFQRLMPNWRPVR